MKLFPTLDSTETFILALASGTALFTIDTENIKILMAGEFDMQKNAIILQSDNDKRWKVTVGDAGNLITTEIAPAVIATGNPIGLLLSLTYQL